MPRSAVPTVRASRGPRAAPSTSTRGRSLRGQQVGPDRADPGARPRTGL